MPKCVNCEGCYYLGTEPSPRGRGYHAKAEKINAEKIGLDGHVWHVKEYSAATTTTTTTPTVTEKGASNCADHALRSQKRWVRGTSPVDSEFVWAGRVFDVSIHMHTDSSSRKNIQWCVCGSDHGDACGCAGMLMVGKDPYKVSSWLPYMYERVDSTHIVARPNSMGIPMRPVRVKEFVRAYLAALT